MNRHRFSACLVSLCAALVLAALNYPASAATGTLSISPTSGSAALTTTWTNSVTMSSGSSYWIGMEPHTNNLTTGEAINWGVLSVGPYFGPGTYTASSFTIILGTAGTWECYVIDSGATTNTIPYTPWSISTNHVTVTVS